MAGVNKALAQNDKDFSSYIKTVDDRLNNAMTAIKQNAIAHEQLAEELHTSAYCLEQFITTTSSALAKELASSNYVSHQLDKLRQAVSDLAEDQLSPSLITPRMLAKTINDIQYTLMKQYPNYQLVISDTTFHYEYADFSVVRKKRIIY